MRARQHAPAYHPSAGCATIRPPQQIPQFEGLAVAIPWGFESPFRTRNLRRPISRAFSFFDTTVDPELIPLAVQSSPFRSWPARHGSYPQRRQPSTSLSANVGRRRQTRRGQSQTASLIADSKLLDSGAYSAASYPTPDVQPVPGLPLRVLRASPSVNRTCCRRNVDTFNGQQRGPFVRRSARRVVRPVPRSGLRLSRQEAWAAGGKR